MCWQQGVFEQSLYREASKIPRSMATPLRWQVAKPMWGDFCPDRRACWTGLSLWCGCSSSLQPGPPCCFSWETICGKSAELSPLGSHFSPLSSGGLHAWQRRFWSACPGLKDRLSGTRLSPTHLMVTLLSLSEAYVCMFRDPTSDPHVGQLARNSIWFCKASWEPS